MSYRSWLQLDNSIIPYLSLVLKQQQLLRCSESMLMLCSAQNHTLWFHCVDVSWLLFLYDDCSWTWSLSDDMFLFATEHIALLMFVFSETSVVKYDYIHWIMQLLQYLWLVLTVFFTQCWLYVTRLIFYKWSKRELGCFRVRLT